MRRIAAIVLCALLAGFGPGETYTPPEMLASAPALPPGYDLAHAMRLDLTEALRIAMHRHLGIAIDRKTVEATDLALRAARVTMYEPSLTAGYTHDNVAGDSYSLGVGSTLPTGAKVDAGATRSGATTGFHFSVVQPLLRGFSPDLDIPRYSILTARIASEQQRHTLEASAASLVQQTEAAYWDVVSALYSYDVTVKSRQLAADTVALVRRQIDAGMVAPADLTGAQNTLAQREVAVLTSAQSVEQAWDALRTILDLPREDWQRALLPTDRPHFAPTEPLATDAAFALALRHRPEVATANLDLDASRLAVRKADNDALPQIDVSLEISAEDTHATSPFAASPGPAGISGMVTFAWTPWSAAAKLTRKAARIQHEVHEIQRDQRLQAIWNDVRTATRNQRAAALEVIAASQSRKLAIESLDIETRKYVGGSSSNINVATLQSGLASAELTELQSLISYEKAETAMLLATGQLLAQRHIDFTGGRR